MRIDLKKDRKELYQPPADRFVEVEVPPAAYLAVDGHGDPNTAPEYAAAVESLYAVAYAVRTALKQRAGVELVVGPLEGLWSSADPSSFVAGSKADWDWTMLIPLPAQVEGEDVQTGLTAAARKKAHLPIDRVQHVTLHEGRCLQTLHVGSYDEEAPVLLRLHQEVMPELGVTWNGRHHEIYLSDPRRVAPEKLRTVLRQPVTDEEREQ